MYVPELFRCGDRDAVLDLLDAYPFATLLTVAPTQDPGADASGIAVSHIPLLLERADGSWGRLLGHVARGNPHWQLFDGERESVAIFHGPHAYVSPTWYASKESPPTWNYAVVHAWGRPRRLAGADPSAVLDQLVARHERGPEPFALSEPVRRSLERAIVAFELPISRVEAKFKLGQNKQAPDRDGTVVALERDGSELAHELAAWTRRITGAR